MLISARKIERSQESLGARQTGPYAKIKTPSVFASLSYAGHGPSECHCYRAGAQATDGNGAFNGQTTERSPTIIWNISLVRSLEVGGMPGITMATNKIFCGQGAVAAKREKSA